MKKLCKDCGEEKNINKFVFRSYRLKTGKNEGKQIRHTYCKLCMVRRSKEWIEKNREKYRNYQNNYKKSDSQTN